MNALATFGGTQSDVAKIRRELEAKAAMIDNNVEAILAYDTKNRLVYCNQAGLQLCGVEDIAELQNSEFPQVRTLGNGSGLPLSAALSRGTFFKEMFIEVKPAKVLPCLVHSNQIYDTRGALMLSYASVLDTTEKHAYRVRLERFSIIHGRSRQRRSNFGILSG